MIIREEANGKKRCKIRNREKGSLRRRGGVKKARKKKIKVQKYEFQL